MKKRLISILLTLLVVMGLLPTAAFAAETPEEALGEVQIYNGGYKMSYLSINGRVRELIYTYYNYDNGSGSIREIPAYCVNPNIYGVPQSVPEGESIEYLADEKASDPKVVGIVANGYPTRSLQELGLENKYQGYYATKMALWTYLLGNWNINNLKVNPALTGVELQRAQKILAAAKDIYARGTAWTEMLSPEVTCTPDRETAYEVTVDGRQYKQQVFTFWSKTWVCDYAVNVSFTNPDEVPEGTRIVDMNNKDISTITTEATGDGYAGKFKVLYPLDSVAGETGSVQLSFSTNVYKYAVFYAICQETDKYGNLQNYVVDTDPTVTMRISAYSNYADEPTVEYDTGLRILKYETGTEIPIAGALFEVIGPDGDSIGTFVTNGDGRIEIPLKKSGNYTVIEREAASHYVISEEPAQNVTVYDEVAEVTFFNDPYGSLRIEKKSNTGMNLPGAVITITHIESGQTFTQTTSSAGVAVFDEIPLGAYRIQEVAAPVGWKLDDTVTVYNDPVGGVEIIKVNASKTSERIPDTTFEIRRMDDALVGTITTDDNGRAFLALEDGAYYALEIEANPDFVLDDTPHYFEVKDGKVTSLRVTNAAKSGILIHKVDTSGEGIYGVKFLLYDEDRNPIGEFTSDDNGYVYITAEDLPDGANTSGRFYLRELEAAEGYILDKEYKTVYVRPGRTAEIEWVNEAITGQIQIYKYAAEANPVTGDPAGTPLKGAVYEIINERSGKVVDYITTDARGVAASKPLPLTRYKIREVTAPAYYQIDPTVHDVTLEYAGQIIKIAAYDKPANLKVTVTKTGNKQLLAGDSMRYDLTVY